MVVWSLGSGSEVTEGVLERIMSALRYFDIGWDTSGDCNSVCSGKGMRGMRGNRSNNIRSISDSTVSRSLFISRPEEVGNVAVSGKPVL